VPEAGHNLPVEKLQYAANGRALVAVHGLIYHFLAKSVKELA
jgi:hypothetical protein